MADDVTTTKTFDDLLSLVEGAYAVIPGAGEMAAYDTADRIGLRMGLRPDRIYMHRGTRQGAEALVPDLRATDRSIRIDQLPAELRVLSARELEDVLCIFKDVFRGRARVSECGRSRNGRRGIC